MATLPEFNRFNRFNKFNKFNELPPEIQERILRQYPQTLQQTPQVSSYVSELMAPVYIKEICGRPISKREFLRYLETQPNRLAYFKLMPYNEDDETRQYNALQSYTFENLNNEECRIDVGFAGLSDIIGVSYFFGIDVIINPALYELPCEDRDVMRDTNFQFLDVWTQYLVYKQRLSCLRIHPDYAKTQVLLYFNTIVNGGYKQWYPETATSGSDMLADCRLYLFLFINAYILAIDLSNYDRLELELKNLSFRRHRDNTINMSSISTNTPISRELNAKNADVLRQIRQGNQDLTILIRQKLESL